MPSSSFLCAPATLASACLSPPLLCSDADVVLQLPFPGRAYIRLSDLKTQPPPRFTPGARVHTHFGRGVVRAIRYRAAANGGVDYEVDLIENRLSGWTREKPSVAKGFLSSGDVRSRGDAERTAEECIADGDLLRRQGNDAYQVRRWGAQLCVRSGCLVGL